MTTDPANAPQEPEMRKCRWCGAADTDEVLWNGTDGTLFCAYVKQCRDRCTEQWEKIRLELIKIRLDNVKVNAALTSEVASLRDMLEICEAHLACSGDLLHLKIAALLATKPGSAPESNPNPVTKE